MNISLESPNQPGVLKLIEDLDAFQIPLYPAESYHGVDIATLSRPNVLFAGARDENNIPVACGAILLTANYGEGYRFSALYGNFVQNVRFGKFLCKR